MQSEEFDVGMKAGEAAEDGAAVPAGRARAGRGGTAAVAAATEKRPAGRSRRPTRAERVTNVREAIFLAAATVVGEHGYWDASVNRITELAGIAQGTFYHYFESRQALMDELLTHVGLDLLKAMGTAVIGASGFYDIEERGYRAFFEHMRKHPWLFRVLNEAEVAAPLAYGKYLAVATAHYIASLRRSVEAGEIASYGEAELEALAHMLIAARTALYRRYYRSTRVSRRQIDAAVAVYMKLVRGGVR
ncbi:TetR/AcrR family transcriptional regulator [Aromatoleum toluclasticum]|uniref:TetR/AcrR family transcriptional regulator n=1 Tax=Aromatoleum toluclasticum TaxID=92003 RepID=UPI00036AB5B6|nr:TetR/AcrR family transcriptional regulator [Aromatoleum toluclasticum]MCC4114808.1 TetR/AcrR family transcriptional regulator [Aromatoleum toluclasticum]